MHADRDDHRAAIFRREADPQKRKRFRPTPVRACHFVQLVDDGSWKVQPVRVGPGRDRPHRLRLLRPEQPGYESENGVDHGAAS